MNANAEITAAAAVRVTPNSRANTGIAGARIPKPIATANATALSTTTSRGRPRAGFRNIAANRRTRPVTSMPRAVAPAS